ncbi:MAG: DMT family transporter [Alphaproteobacteria bacterium]
MKDQASIAGYLIVVVAAVAFAGNNAFAVLAYEGGASPLTLITYRMIFTLFVLAAFMRITGIPLGLSARDSRSAMLLGLLNGTMAFCLMSAFDNVEIGLAILVFYLYPVFTGFGAWLGAQEKLDRGIVIGLVGGFCGLALAIDVTGERGNAIGLALAGVASVMMAATALVGARILKTDNSRAVTLHMHVSASAMFILISIGAGEMSLPNNTPGWIGFAAVPLFYTVAITAFFGAIPYIGAVRASLVMNLEPIASIALGFIVLHQVLTIRQLAGAMIVIIAVSATKLIGGKSRHQKSNEME